MIQPLEEYKMLDKSTMSEREEHIRSLIGKAVLVSGQNWPGIRATVIDSVTDGGFVHLWGEKVWHEDLGWQKPSTFVVVEVLPDVFLSQPSIAP
jgi:hypothetical protein